MPAGKQDTPEQANVDQTFGGFFRGVGNVLDAVADILDTADGTRGNARPARSRPASPSERTRSRLNQQISAAMSYEPLVDIFDEGGEIVLVVEAPGATADEIRIEMRDDILSFETTGERRYAKDILLASFLDTQSLRWTYRNGIVDVRIAKREG